VVVGFPLHGLLASEANVTTGTVSALAGIGNDTRFLQITAPVQPGNSGGPLLDAGGHIVGIVVSKLDAINIAKATGDIPQNINFAIKDTIAKSFLDSQSVEYETETSSTTREFADIGAAAKKFTLLLECLR
jgi:S1-C subfamily serine protease